MVSTCSKASATLALAYACIMPPATRRNLLCLAALVAMYTPVLLARLSRPAARAIAMRVGPPVPPLVRHRMSSSCAGHPPCTQHPAVRIPAQLADTSAFDATATSVRTRYYLIDPPVLPSQRRHGQIITTRSSAENVLRFSATSRSCFLSFPAAFGVTIAIAWIVFCTVVDAASAALRQTKPGCAASLITV
eukprot:1952893-Pleurochrysis_carterae.AAC.1